MQQLRDALATVRAEGGDTEANRHAFYTATHDLKGLGSTLGYPLVSRISGSLSRLIESMEGPLAPHMQTITSHVNAITAVVAQSAKSDGDALGTQLAGELEDLVNKALAG